MRSILSFIFLLILASPARAENTAEKMAAELKKIVDSYQAQIDKKIKAEQGAYETAAKLYASAQEERTFQSLTVDRLSIANSVSASLIDGRTTVNEFLFDQLPTYAHQDFDHTKGIFSEQNDAYRAFLTNLQSLTVDKTNALALSTALDNLSKKARMSDWLASMQSYGAAVSKQLKYSDCALSVSRLSMYSTQKDQLQTRLAGTLSQDEKTRVQNDLKAVNQQITSLQAERDATGLFDATNKTCNSPQ